ncbi:MAG: class I SAM-dependent methyltransferase [Treponema sp.]|jgi:SAM-dependent methyltransferase|nr:class I SAM-dependent methyltransferase [Treponema sp.]
MVRRRKEWFNDEDFWERYAPIMFDDSRWAEVPLAADGVTRLAGLDLYPPESPGPGAEFPPCPPRLLDLCCGFGRMTLEFTRRGFTCTGVDSTESYLKTAAGDAAAENLDIELVRADIRDFVRPACFDLAVNLYVSFGYFADPQDDKQVLLNAYQSLKEGGTLIIETLGKEIAVRDFVKSEWFRRAGCYVLTEYTVIDSWASLRNRWTLLKEGERIEKEFTQRLYAASELRALLLEAGFSRVEIYGGWDESPYDERAEKLIAVGRK